MLIPEISVASIHLSLINEHYQLNLKFKKYINKNNNISAYVKIYNLFSDDLFSINIDKLKLDVVQSSLHYQIINSICPELFNDRNIRIKNIFVETNDFIYQIIEKEHFHIVGQVFDKEFFVDFSKLSF